MYQAIIVDFKRPQPAVMSLLVTIRRPIARAIILSTIGCEYMFNPEVKGKVHVLDICPGAYIIIPVGKSVDGQFGLTARQWSTVRYMICARSRYMLFYLDNIDLQL